MCVANSKRNVVARKTRAGCAVIGRYVEMNRLVSLFALWSCLAVLVTSLPFSRHNFFLAPFKERFYADGVDPTIISTVEQKLANQDPLYSTVMAAIRDDFAKDSKLGQNLELKMSPSTKKRHYHNSFDVLAGGGLG